MTKQLVPILFGMALGASAMAGVWLVWEATKTPCPCKGEAQP